MHLLKETVLKSISDDRVALQFLDKLAWRGMGGAGVRVGLEAVTKHTLYVANHPAQVRWDTMRPSTSTVRLC